MAYTTVTKPKAHFEVKTYAGSSSAKTISGVGFKPDIVWTKDRTDAYQWAAYDSSRGVKRWLKLDGAQSENNNEGAALIDASLTAFNSDGFTIAAMSSDPVGNKNGDQFLTYMWKANGGSTSSNSAGANGASIASAYQANTTSGCSIVTYTGTGSAGTIKHGLSVAPKFMMVKKIGTGSNPWQLYHGDDGIIADTQTDYMQLNDATGWTDNANRWNDTKPTTAVFSVGIDTSVNESGDTYVAYVFAETKGFSNFGTYFGVSNNANGPFVYTGFRPAMVIVKRTDGNENFIIQTLAGTKIKKDGSQGINGNRVEQRLFINDAAAENSTAGDVDFYSNGFKPRDTDGVHNYTDYKYVYIAFAEMPIVGTNGTIALGT